MIARFVKSLLIALVCASRAFLGWHAVEVFQFGFPLPFESARLAAEVEAEGWDGLLFADSARHNLIGVSADESANRSVKMVVVIL